MLSFLAGFLGTSSLIGKSSDLTCLESVIYVLLTFIACVTVSLLNLKVAQEFDLLRRVLTTLGRVTEKVLSRIGYRQEDPFDLINEHIRLQKRGNPLYPFMDNSLRGKIANLENNISQDV